MDNTINNNLDTYVEAAQSAIEKCRPGDWEHAKRVVNWVKELTPLDFPDRQIIIKAAYIHDIGWRNVLPAGTQTISKDELTQFEPQANSNTKPFVTEFLTKLGHTQNDIDTIINLIHAADTREAHTLAESIIVDSDNLSKLNLAHVREKYGRADWIKIYNLFKDALPQRLSLPTSKKIFAELLPKLKAEMDAELAITAPIPSTP